MNPVALTAHWKRLRESLLADFPDIDPETLRDTIDGETGVLDAAASLIRDSEEDKALASGLKDYIASLTRRKDRLSDRAMKRRSAALSLMQEIGERRLIRPDFTASVGAGAPGTRIVDDKALPAWAWRTPAPVLDTQTIRARLLAGEEVPGATLSNGEEHLTVRT